jgi:hypothetical protein
MVKVYALHFCFGFLIETCNISMNGGGLLDDGVGDLLFLTAFSGVLYRMGH